MTTCVPRCTWSTWQVDPKHTGVPYPFAIVGDRWVSRRSVLGCLHASLIMYRYPVCTCHIIEWLVYQCRQ